MMRARIRLCLIFLLMLGIIHDAWAFSAREPQVDPEMNASARKMLDDFLSQEHGEASARARDAQRLLEKLKGIRPEQVSELIPGLSDGKEATDNKKPFSRYALLVSSSIPLATLRTYVRQINVLAAEGIHVSIRLRGFVKGMHRLGPTISFYLALCMKDTAGQVSEHNLNNVEFLVDPGIFKKYQVGSVPALVDTESGCIVSGDATLFRLIDDVKTHRCGERQGATFQIAENDPVQEIETAVSSASVQHIREQLYGNLMTRLSNIPSGVPLPPAKEDSTRLIEFTSTLPFTVPDPETDRVLYPKGFRFYPLDYVSPQGCLVIFNGSRSKEAAWIHRRLQKDLFESPARLLTLSGNIPELSAMLKRPVFSANTVAEKVFGEGWCRAIPCVLSFRNRKIYSQEFYVPDITQ